MLRGILGPMEKHHKVRISDAAVVAAVKLSHRYIPARQLPDKAVSLLDTACARVAISQIDDAGRDRGRSSVAIAAREKEKAALGQRAAISAPTDARRARARSPRSDELTAGIASMPRRASVARSGAAQAGVASRPSRALRSARSDAERCRREPSCRRCRAGRPREPAPRRPRTTQRGRTRAASSARSKASIPEKRMIYAHVDEQAVASVVSDWTGIPVGRMVEDEVETVLKLADILNQARRRPGPRPADDRQAHRDQPRQARQPEQADRRVHAVRPVRRRQDRDRAGARRGALRRRAEHDHHQHVASSRRRTPSRR